MSVQTTSRPPAADQQPPGLLHRVSGWAMRQAGLAVFLWVLALVAVTVASTLVGSAYRNDNSLPGTDSQKVIDTFREHQPKGSTDSIQLVLYDEGGLAGSAKGRIEPMLAEVGKLPHVAGVANPFTSSGSVSQDGRTAYATVSLDVAGTDLPAEDVRTIIHKAQDI